MDFFSSYQSHLKKYLTQSQILTLQLLIWLLQTQKDVRIERLASCLPIPILYESRRKKIQRLLSSSSFSLCLFWFPIIKFIVQQEFKKNERLILILDRTQWQNDNIFMISVRWRKRALPINWLVLKKKGSSNLREQINLIKPVLKLFSDYQVLILGDREFHGIELSYSLKTSNKKAKNTIYFAFREKDIVYLNMVIRHGEGTSLSLTIKRNRKNEQILKDLSLVPGVKVLHRNVQITKRKGFGKFNLLAYKKRDYRHHKVKDTWFIITNFSEPNEVINLLPRLYWKF